MCTSFVIVDAVVIITQAVSLGLAFGFFFLRSVTNRHLVSIAHASLMLAYGTKQQKLSSWKATSLDTMISRAMKSHTNEHTVRGRPTLKVVKRFRKGSVCKAYERSTQFTSERFEWIYQESCYAKGASYQPGLSTLHLDKKHLQKRHRIFRRDREPSRIPTRTHNVWETRAERLENMFLLLTNVSVRVHLSKTLWETS